MDMDCRSPNSLLAHAICTPVIAALARRSVDLKRVTTLNYFDDFERDATCAKN
jgi:hypothetical protein